MSEENVERVRQAYAAWNRGDLDAGLSMMHPDAEWRTSGLFPDSDPVYRGRPAIRHWFETVREPWERFSAELVDVIPQGDTVVAEVVFKAVGRESATNVTLPFAHLFRFKAALVIEVSAYPSVEEALEAARLRE